MGRGLTPVTQRQKLQRQNLDLGIRTQGDFWHLLQTLEAPHNLPHQQHDRLLKELNCQGKPKPSQEDSVTA